MDLDFISWLHAMIMDYSKDVNNNKEKLLVKKGADTVLSVSLSLDTRHGSLLYNLVPCIAMKRIYKSRV